MLRAPGREPGRRNRRQRRELRLDAGVQRSGDRPRRTFKPTIIGFGAVLDNLSAFVDNTARPIVIVGAAAAYVLLWLFLAGGIIDRYARDRATGAHGFFSASGVFFFRFLRLAVVMSLVYGLLFGYVHGWLFDARIPA